MKQLHKLDACRPNNSLELPALLKHIETPVNLATWERAMLSHPDRQFTNFILKGLSEGFRVGYQYDTAELKQEGKNMPCSNPQVITEYLQNELKANRVVRLSEEEASTAEIHCSSIGIIPKKNKPGKWRLIVDLSSPPGGSVNDGIDKELCSLSYTSVDIIGKKVLSLGKGSLLAKMDIKQAYRMIPVHPDDRHLLGMRWQGAVYVDKALPFGLRSASIIFSAVADALQWIMMQRGISFMEHYIDDFITVGRPNSDECKRNTAIMHAICRETGTPVEEGKSEGPTTVITFLGIEIDSVCMELRLPADKLHRLQQLLCQWRGKKACKKQELESLIGSLSHACKVVSPGRAFIRRQIDLSKLAIPLCQVKSRCTFRHRMVAPVCKGME